MGSSSQSTPPPLEPAPAVRGNHPDSAGGSRTRDEGPAPTPSPTPAPPHPPREVDASQQGSGSLSARTAMTTACRDVAPLMSGHPLAFPTHSPPMRSGLRVLGERTRLARAVASGLWCVAVTDGVLSSDGTTCELPQRSLGVLPCLHAEASPAAAVGVGTAELRGGAPRGGRVTVESAHGSGVPLVARVTTLNLRNNSLTRLTPTALTERSPTHHGTGGDGSLGPVSPATSLAMPCALAAFLCVTSLDLTNNELVSLDGIEALPSLISLRASRNCLPSLAPLWLSPHVGRLEVLDVSANNLSEVLSVEDAQRLRARPDTLALRSLAATDNSIREVTTTFELFAKLETLRLRRNKLTRVDESFPECCPLLRTLDLYANRLDEASQVVPLCTRAGTLERCVDVDVRANVPRTTTPSPERGAADTHGEPKQSPTHGAHHMTTAQDGPSSRRRCEDLLMRHEPTAGPRASPTGLTSSIRARHADPSCDGAPFSPERRPRVTAGTGAAAGLHQVTSPSTKSLKKRPVKPSDTTVQPSSTTSTPTTPPKPRARGGPCKTIVNTQAFLTPAIAAATVEERPPTITATETASAELADVPAAVPRGVTRVAPNEWEVNMQELSGVLAKSLARAMHGVRGSRASSSCWTAAPPLALIFGEPGDAPPTHPTLTLQNLDTPTTEGARCRNTVSYLLQGLVTPREPAPPRAPTRYKGRTSSTWAAAPTSSSATRNSLGHPISVNHILAGRAGDSHGNAWPYLRWRREWEAQANARGLQLVNHYWLSDGSLAGGATVGERLGSGVGVVRPVPPLWCALYESMIAAVPSTFSRPVGGRGAGRRRSSGSVHACACACACGSGGRRPSAGAGDGAEGDAPSRSVAVPTAAQAAAVSGTCNSSPSSATAAVAGSGSRWCVPAAHEHGGDVQGTWVAWPAHTHTHTHTHTPARLFRDAGRPSSTHVLDLAFHVLATCLRVDEAEVRGVAAAVTAQAHPCPLPVYTSAEAGERRGRFREQRRAAAEGALAALCGTRERAGPLAWAEVEVDIPCAARMPGAPPLTTRRSGRTGPAPVSGDTGAVKAGSSMRRGGVVSACGTQKREGEGLRRAEGCSGHDEESEEDCEERPEVTHEPPHGSRASSRSVDAREGEAPCVLAPCAEPQQANGQSPVVRLAPSHGELAAAGVCEADARETP